MTVVSRKSGRRQVRWRIKVAELCSTGGGGVTGVAEDGKTKKNWIRKGFSHNLKRCPFETPLSRHPWWRAFFPVGETTWSCGKYTEDMSGMTFRKQAMDRHGWLVPFASLCVLPSPKRKPWTGMNMQIFSLFLSNRVGGGKKKVKKMKRYKDEKI